MKLLTYAGMALLCAAGLTAWAMAMTLAIERFMTMVGKDPRG